MMKILFILMMFLSGCASMFNGSEQTLTIKTHEKSEIFINDRFSGVGYASKKVSRDQSHTIKIVSEDCEQTYTTQSEFNTTALLGILIDLGLFSIPADFISGAAWNISPNKIRVLPDCESK